MDELKNNFQLFLISAQEKSKTNVMPTRPPTFQTYRPLVSSTPARPRAQSVKRSREASPPQDATTDVTQFEDALAGDESFEVVDRHKKKKARVDGGPNAINAPKQVRDVVIGSGQSSSSGFRGIPPKPRFVPQAFVFRCDPVSTDEKKVFHHLAEQHIHVLDVKQVSHPQSQFKSFRITVEKYEDYNKIISGHYIPPYVRVKRYITPKSERGDANNVNHFRDAVGTVQDENYRQKISDLASTLESAQKAVESRRSDADPMETAASASDPVQRTLNTLTAVTAASGLTTNTLTREHNDAE